MDNVKRMRKKAGMTQAQIAEKMGMTQGAVALWESGKRMPRSGKLKKLAAVLDCSVDDLLSGTEAAEDPE